jgi:hypothetical protein
MFARNPASAQLDVVFLQPLDTTLTAGSFKIGIWQLLPSHIFN